MLSSKLPSVDVHLLPVANKVWGKVMFLLVSVILFIGVSLYDVTFCLAAWSHVPPKGVSVSVQGSLSGRTSFRRVSFQGVSVQGVSVQEVLCTGVSVQGGLCPGGSLSSESLSSGFSVQGLCPRCLCPVGSLSRGLCPGFFSVQGVLGALCQRDTPGQRPPSPTGTLYYVYCSQKTVILK